MKLQRMLKMLQTLLTYRNVHWLIKFKPTKNFLAVLMTLSSIKLSVATGASKIGTISKSTSSQNF